MKKLENKTVFITGGLSGIGHACALAAAKEGANVVVGDIQSDATEKNMEELKKLNPKALFVICDVSIPSQVEAAIKKSVSTFGTLDVAMNNAGIGGEPHKLADMPEEAWAKVIAINLTGVFHCMKYELIAMAKQKSGVIVNTASILGKVGFAQSSHYVAAKHGVVGLTQTAALEYALEGIRINALCPGFINTPLLTKAGFTTHPEAKKFIIDSHPMKRLGNAEEIANGFIFLACNESSFMTGSTLEIDGGYLCQ